MPIKDKNKTLAIIRNTPYSGLKSLLQDLFYKDKTGVLAEKAYELLKTIYSKPIPVKEWGDCIKKLFNVNPITSDDSNVLDQLCFKHFGFHRENLDASKSRLRGKKPYHLLLLKQESGEIKLTQEEISVIKQVSAWHSAVASYYSIINKLKAVGLIDKREGVYQKSSKLKKRFTQAIDLINGFENEIH